MTQDTFALIYFVIGFFAMAIPVFDKRTAASFDKLNTASFLVGCMIMWIAWPLLFWIAIKTLPPLKERTMSKKVSGVEPQTPVTEKEKIPRPYKLQRPLASSGPFEYLLYSRDREIQYHLNGPDAHVDQLMNGQNKIFILAHFTADMKIVIHHILPDQGF